MKGPKTSWVDTVLWSFLAAIFITGIAHALAMMLPNWLSAGAARQMSGFEKLASRYSEYWLANVVWLAALVATLSFLLMLPLLRRRATAASRDDSGAG